MRDQTTSRVYEMMVITFPEVEPEALLATPVTIQSYIESAGGTVIKITNDSPWGRRRLAYPIRHQSRDIRDGFYTLSYFEADPDQIPAIERDLKLDETLMRYLLLHIGEMPVFPEPEEEEVAGDESGETEASAAAPSEKADDEESGDSANTEESAPNKAETAESVEVEEVVEETVVEDADGEEVVEVEEVVEEVDDESDEEEV